MSFVEELMTKLGVEATDYSVNCTGCEHVSDLVVVNNKPVSWECAKYNWGYCPKAKQIFPEFTLEKQIEILTQFYIETGRDEIKGMATIHSYLEYIKRNAMNLRVDETIAARILSKFDELSDEFKAKVKAILEKKNDD